MTTVGQGGLQGRVQYHDLSNNNNNNNSAVERQDSYNNTQHQVSIGRLQETGYIMTVQVYSPPSAALVSTEHCLSVEPDTTMVTSGHTIQGEKQDLSEFAESVK